MLRIEHRPYKPRKIDKDWLQEWMDMVVDGGIIGYPRSGLLYQKVDSKKIKLVLAEDPNGLGVPSTIRIWQQDDFDATYHVAKALGIEVDESYVLNRGEALGWALVLVQQAGTAPEAEHGLDPRGKPYPGKYPGKPY